MEWAFGVNGDEEYPIIYMTNVIRAVNYCSIFVPLAQFGRALDF